MEFGSIEKSIYIEASPAVVYDVVSSPEHMTHWFIDEAAFEAVPGGSGQVVFEEGGRRNAVPLTVVEAVPGVRFSFRWSVSPAPEMLPVGTELTPGNSLLVSFDLAPEGSGTQLTVTESGMRELGWEAAVLEHYYNDHSAGWAELISRIGPYVAQLAAR